MYHWWKEEIVIEIISASAKASLDAFCNQLKQNQKIQKRNNEVENLNVLLTTEKEKIKEQNKIKEEKEEIIFYRNLRSAIIEEKQKNT